MRDYSFSATIESHDILPHNLCQRFGINRFKRTSKSINLRSWHRDQSGEWHYGHVLFRVDCHFGDALCACVCVSISKWQSFSLKEDYPFCVNLENIQTSTMVRLWLSHLRQARDQPKRNTKFTIFLFFFIVLRLLFPLSPKSSQQHERER